MRKTLFALVLAGMVMGAMGPAQAAADGDWSGELDLWTKLFTSSNCKAWTDCSDLEGTAISYIDMEDEMDAARQEINDDPNDDKEIVWVNAQDATSPSSDMLLCFYDGNHRLLDCHRSTSMGSIAGEVPFNTDHGKLIVLNGVDTPWDMTIYVTMDFGL